MSIRNKKGENKYSYKKGAPRQRNSPLLNIKYITITIYSPAVKKRMTGNNNVSVMMVWPRGKDG